MSRETNHLAYLTLRELLHYWVFKLDMIGWVALGTGISVGRFLEWYETLLSVWGSAQCKYCLKDRDVHDQKVLITAW